MANINKAIAGLKGIARETAKDNSPILCGCGSCKQAVLQADEVLKTGVNMDCALWVMQVGAAIFARGTDMATAIGMPREGIDIVFHQMVKMSHKHGMSPDELTAHFDQARKLTPKKGKS